MKNRWHLQMERVPLPFYMEEDPHRRSRFPETNWALVERAAGTDENDRSVALSDLCSLYWPPIYAYIRSQGAAPHDAEDLTQDFFSDFICNSPLARADPDKGRLRSYLLKSVKHFLISEHRKGVRQKRGGGVKPLSLDAGEGEARCHQIAADDPDPDRVYDRLWAATLMEQVMRRLRDRYEAKGNLKAFDRMCRYIRNEPVDNDLRNLAADFSQSEATVRVALHRLRQRFKAILREEVSATLGIGENLEEELRYLRSVV